MCMRAYPEHIFILETFCVLEARLISSRVKLGTVFGEAQLRLICDDSLLRL